VFNQVLHQLGKFLRINQNLIVLLIRQPANIAYFLITINGTTYNQTLMNNLALNSLVISTITQTNNQLLCSNQTQILPLQNSIQDFYISCPIPQMSVRKLSRFL
jgi:hypothetical protein